MRKLLLAIMMSALPIVTQGQTNTEQEKARAKTPINQTAAAPGGQQEVSDGV